MIVRYWTKADNGRFWPATVCPLLTHIRHGPLRYEAAGHAVTVPETDIVNRRA